MEYFTSAIILAAGSSTRIKSIKDKLLYKIGNITVLEKTINNFQNAETISEIIVVTNLDKIEMVSELSLKYNKIKNTILGGNTRMASAVIGYQAVNKQCDFICFHDCARPYISPSEIDRLVNLSYHQGNLICGKKCTDTIKIIDENNIITETPNRSYCICAQTPQIFKFADYKNSIEKTIDSVAFTDDSQILENNNIKVSFVECREFNDKITTDNDLL